MSEEETHQAATGQTIVTTVSTEKRPIKKRQFGKRFLDWFTMQDKRQSADRRRVMA